MNLRMYKAAAVLSGLIKVCTVPFHDKSSLQCYVGFTELHRFSASTAGFIFETFPTSSDGTYNIGNMNCDIDIKEEEVVKVKTEKVISSEEEKCIDIKDEEDLHGEEEEEEKEDMDIQEEEDIKIKEEVRMRIQCNIL